ncbi:MAG: cadherin-like beta sandwich domain-containing protein [Rhodobacteraceae bacterium]|nr:cadherin-like beta sandwich domain-containing protein [Paracoccaceae bacterium]
MTCARSEVQPRRRCKEYAILPAIFLLLIAAASHFVATPTLAGPYVSNIEQELGAASAFDESVYAQGFTTGSDTAGYEVRSLRLKLEVTGGGLTPSQIATIRAELWSSDSFGRPRQSLASFSVPSSFGPTVMGGRAFEFSAPPNFSLRPNTNYFIVLYTTGDLTSLRALFTQSGEEDAGVEPGWSIADKVLWFASNLPGSRWDTRHYELRIGIVGPLSTNNNLTALSASTSTSREGTYTPLTLTPETFDKATTRYTATVRNSTTHAKVTPTLEEPYNATVRVGKGTNLFKVQSGTASSAIALDVGENVINVEVAAEDGSRKIYTITIVRYPAPGTMKVIPGAANGGPSIIVALGVVPDNFAARIQFKQKASIWPQPSASNSLPSGAMQETSLSTARSLVFTGFLQKTEYDVRQHLVAKSNNNELSESSATQSVITWTVPGPPTGVMVTPGDGMLSVSWNEPTFTGGAGAKVTDFKVRWRVKDTDADMAGNQPGSWNESEGVNSSSTTSHTMSGLANGSTYEVQVRALNGIDPGSKWAAAEGTPTSVVSLSATPNPVDEGETVTVTAALSAALSKTVTIPLTLTAGSAESGDYGTLTGITVNAGEKTGTGTIAANEDADTEDETFTVALQSNLPSGVVAGSPNAVEITVDDNDLVVTLAASPTAVTEGDTVTVTATLSEAPSNNVAIPIDLSAGSAEAGDYGSLSSITVNAGEKTGTGTIAANEDADTEDETFTVALGGSLPPNLVAGSPNSLEILIVDDDTSIPTVRLSAYPNPVAEGESVTIAATLTAALTSAVTIPLTLTAVSAEDDDFGTLESITIAAGATNGSGTIATIVDADTEDETFEVALGSSLPDTLTAGSPSSVEVTISDGDTAVSISAWPVIVEEGEWITVTATLSEQAESTMTVPLKQVMVSAEEGDFEPLPNVTVDAGANSASATMLTMEDDDTEDETLILELDSDMPSGMLVGASKSIEITITDNDLLSAAEEAATRVSLSASPNPVDEGSSVTVTATLSTALDKAVTIPLTLTAGSAEEGDHGALAGISIESGETSGSGSITTIVDADTEDETFTVALGSDLPEDLAAGSPQAVEITIIDDGEVVAEASLSASPNPVAEGSSVTVTAKLSTPLDKAVTIPLTLTAESAEEGDYGALANIAIESGETSGNGTITTIVDADTEDETFKVALAMDLPPNVTEGNPKSVVITIIDEDEGIDPQAWLARFGRTLTGQVVDAVETRISEPRTPGGRATLAGQTLPSWNWEDGGNMTPKATDEGDGSSLTALGEWLLPDDETRMQSRAVGSHELLSGSSFTLTQATDAGGLASFWGRGMHGRFDGREGAAVLHGEVTTGLLGVDWTGTAGQDNWIAGLAVGRTTGIGGWHAEGNGRTDITAELTGLYPYGGLSLGERLSAWMVTGYARGTLVAKPKDGEAQSADLSMAMGAVGLRGLMARQTQDGTGMTLALTTDARVTRLASSDAAGGGMPATEATVWQVRTGIEGSRQFLVGHGSATVTPSIAFGMRWDGGDAERGLGLEMDSRLAYADIASGWEVDVQGRVLLAHVDENYREWGASAGLTYDPDPTSERGIGMSLRRSVGMHSVSARTVLLGADTMAEMAGGHAGSGQPAASSGLEGEIGYGLPAFGGGYTGTPNFGFRTADGGSQDLRIGWKVSPEVPYKTRLELHLDATRHKPSGGRQPVEHGVMLGVSISW